MNRIVDPTLHPCVLSWAQKIMLKDENFLSLLVTVRNKTVLVEDFRAVVEVPKQDLPNNVARKLYSQI